MLGIPSLAIPAYSLALYLGKYKYLPGEDLTVAELEDMISEADTPGNGEVSQKEFLEVMLRTNLFRGTVVDQNR